MSLLPLLLRHQVVITVGAGGVGKTSISAALGFRLAQEGRRVMVVTIDPARRLAAALGLPEIGGEPSNIDLSSLRLTNAGSLDIMMLDSRRVFTRLIERTTVDPARRRRIMENKFFQIFSDAMGGSQEHAAVEQLADLLDEGRYDHIILDTPPSRHALEFLSSPRRLLSWLDDTMLKWLIPSTEGGLAVFSFGSKYISRILGFFAGADTLMELSTFLGLAAEEFRQLRQRAALVEALLHDQRTVFVVVGSPERHGIEGALMFHRALRQDGFRIGAYILNRMRMTIGAPPHAEDLADELGPYLAGGLTDSALIRLLTDAHALHERLATRHTATIKELLDAARTEAPVFAVPAFVEEITTLNGVANLARGIFPDPAQPQEP